MRRREEYMESEREELEMRVHEVDDESRRARLSHTQQGNLFCARRSFSRTYKKISRMF